MKLHRKTFETELDGAKLEIEVSELAHQANAAVLAKHGETIVLAAVVMGHKEANLDYFPLTVDYEERFYAAGKILGSRFMRRENRPSENAILSGRLIDRTIRPLFDQRLRREVQVTLTIMQYDGVHSPDTVALIAASTALGISDIPWGGPVAGVRTKVSEAADHKTYSALFCGTETFINMIELEGQEVQEAKAVELFTSSHETVKKLISFQKGIIAEMGKKKQDVLEPETAPAVKALFTDFLNGKLEDALKNDTLGAVKEALMEHLKTSEYAEEALRHAEHIFETTVDEFVHTYALKEGKRVDGRAFDEVRDLYAEVGLFERLHGSAVFMRGDTQVFAATTLGSPADEQIVENIEEVKKQRFMLHYNFPNYSTGETGRSRGPGRREIGHGALAQKAIAQVIPSKEEFPYTVRVVAETLSSNGSSSQATICSTSLSLMDAGVPIKRPVAGIAIGLMTGEHGDYKILTDIQGPEDHYGDMDFKVAGTDSGIAAIQMDVKIGGITKEIFVDALRAGEKARGHILSVMNEVLSAPRASLSKYAPLIEKISIDPDQIGLVIGPGGKTINGMIEQCGGEIAIDIDEDGTVFVSGSNSEMVKKGVGLVKSLVHEYKVGEVVTGPIIKILEFGAIVDLGAGKDGMIHVSELREGFVKKVEDVVHMGDVVTAKVVRAEGGKVALSLKALQPKTQPEEPKQ